jgi:hypothetical protein
MSDCCLTCGAALLHGEHCKPCAAIYTRLVVVRCQPCQQLWVDWPESDAADVDCRCVCEEPEREQWVIEALPPIEQSLAVLDAARAQVAHCAMSRCPVCWSAGLTAIETGLATIRAVAVVQKLRAAAGQR